MKQYKNKIVERYGKKFIDCEESEWINIFKETINDIFENVGSDI